MKDMYRRRFLGLALGAGAHFVCGCSGHAKSARVRGCRSAHASQEPQLDELLHTSGLGKQVDDYCYDFKDRLFVRFGPYAELYFHRSGPIDMNGSNAFAFPKGEMGPQPVISIGVGLLKEFWFNSQRSAQVVLAHEYGHIVQYEKGLSVEGPWQMEPHADFLAGWVMAERPVRNPYTYYGASNDELTASEAATMFSLGDENFAFNSKDDHGSGEFRAQMVRNGWLAGDEKKLALDDAFAEGARQAGLKF